MQNQTTNEFIRAFKRFISQRAVPEKKYSDSAKAFVASFKWVKYLNKSKAFNHIFNINKIQWRFNLSRVPWWKVVMVPRSIRKYHFSCEEFAPQNRWKNFVILERVRRIVAWHWKSLKIWIPIIITKPTQLWSKFTITIRDSRDKEQRIAQKV